MKQDRNELAVRIHENAVAKGFWDNKNLSVNHCLMLVITELGEAVNADRKGRRADRENYHLILQSECPFPLEPLRQNLLAEANKQGRNLWMLAFEMFIKDTVEDELADAYIRLLDLYAHIVETHSTYKEEDDDRLRQLADIFIHGRMGELTETLFDAIRNLCTYYYSPDELLGNILSTIVMIEHIAKVFEIDLEWHVLEKMRYNENRPRLHGKAY